MAVKCAVQNDKKNEWKSDVVAIYWVGPEKKNTCISGDPRKKNGVGLSEKLFFSFKTFFLI